MELGVGSPSFLQALGTRSVLPVTNSGPVHAGTGKGDRGAHGLLGDGEASLTGEWQEAAGGKALGAVGT